jgi:hypothetical protein
MPSAVKPWNPSISHINKGLWEPGGRKSAGGLAIFKQGGRKTRVKTDLMN